MKHSILIVIGLLCCTANAPISAATPEEEHLVGRIAEDLRRMCEFATKSTVDWKESLKATPKVTDVWHPKSYAAFIVSRSPRLVANDTKLEPEFAQKLLDPTGPGMALASQELSHALTQHPTSPHLHDAAALLACTLALREHSGRFYDVRAILCRATAHLAFARHLSPTPTPYGQLAMTLLETIKGNAKTATALAGQLPALPGDWKEIVDLAITGDWRPMRKTPSMLFKFLRTKALLAASDGELSRREVDRVSELDATIRNRTDWHRIFMEDPPTRKYALNQLERANRLEGAEIAAVLTVMRLKAPNKEDLMALLNTRAGYAIMPDPVGLPKFHVIDWGLWAEHYQRHVCHLLTFFPATHLLERQFAGLDLLPFVLLQQRKQPYGVRRHVLERAIERCSNAPEQVNLTNWLHTQRLLQVAANAGPDPFLPLAYSPHLAASVRTKPALGFVPAGKDLLKRLPDPLSWFSPAPFGSHYRAAYRFEVTDDSTRAKASDADPWNPTLIQWRLRNLERSNLPLDKLDAIAGERSQYDLNVMRAELPQTHERRKLMKRMATLSPQAQVDLARDRFVRGDYTGAATAFLDATDRQLSPVRIAIESPWVIDALKRTQRDDRTGLIKAFAEKGAEHGGPGHRLNYLNVLGETDLETTEKQAIAVQKHFPVECPILYFHLFLGRLQDIHAGANNVSTALGVIRHSPSLSESERLQAFKRAEAVVFPGGRTKFIATRHPPRGRLALAKVQDALSEGGISQGDLIVAFNGTEVADIYQYHYLRWENGAPTGILTLWNPTRGYYQYPCTFKTWDAGTAFSIVPASSEVANRIAEATTTLNLSGLGLREVPKGVFGLTGLKGLDLSNNPLGSVPPTIKALTNLEVLKLSNCGLSKLPSEISQLKALKWLDLAANTFEACPESVGALASLVTLDLRHNDLPEISDSILKIASLKTLRLSGNAIATIPEEIRTLVELTSLDLGNNGFDTFPASVCALPKLKNLLLYDNAIASVPDAVGKMTALTRLDLRKNLLTELPESLTKAVDLERLYLGGNLLASVPAVTFKLAKLADLDLGRNYLMAVPMELASLTALRRVIVSNNRLETLPDFLTEMPNLRSVYYGGNRIPALVVASLMKRNGKIKYSVVTYE